MANLCDIEMRISGDFQKAMQLEGRLGNLGAVYNHEIYDFSEEEGYVECSGDCAWSAYSALLLDNDRGGKFLDAVRDMGLRVEIYGSEQALGFMEHYLVDRGEVVLDETIDYHELALSCFDDDTLAACCDTLGYSEGELWEAYNDETELTCVGGYEVSFDWAPAKPSELNLPLRGAEHAEPEDVTGQLGHESDKLEVNELNERIAPEHAEGEHASRTEALAR